MKYVILILVFILAVYEGIMLTKAIIQKVKEKKEKKEKKSNEDGLSSEK